MAEGGETPRPPQEVDPGVKPPAQDSVQRGGISSALRAAVEKVWRSWGKGPEGMVDAMSQAPTRLSPFSKEPPSNNPIKGLDEPS